MIRSIIATGDLEPMIENNCKLIINNIIIFLRVSIPPLLTGPQVLYTPGLLPAQIHTNARRWLSVQRGASEYQNLPRERT